MSDTMRVKEAAKTGTPPLRECPFFMLQSTLFFLQTQIRNAESALSEYLVLKVPLRIFYL